MAAVRQTADLLDAGDVRSKPAPLLNKGAGLERTLLGVNAVHLQSVVSSSYQFGVPQVHIPLATSLLGKVYSRMGVR